VASNPRVTLVDGVVDDQVHAAVVTEEPSWPTGRSSVLVDEALARLRDEDAAIEPPRRRQRDRHLAGVHAADVGAGAHRHADRAAVVAVDAELVAAAREERAVRATISRSG
jgi:hypothetical protein